MEIYQLTGPDHPVYVYDPVSCQTVIKLGKHTACISGELIKEAKSLHGIDIQCEMLKILREEYEFDIEVNKIMNGDNDAS